MSKNAVCKFVCLGERFLMQKRLLLSIFIMFSIIFLSGCQSEQTEKSDVQPLDGNLTVHGGSVGGVWSLFTEGISEAVRKEFPGTLISAVPGTVAGNPVLVDQKETDFAIAESLTARFAYEGKEPFDKKYEHIRAVAAIMPENVFQLVAPVDAPFDSIEDIVQEQLPLRYSAGERNALGDIVSAAIFNSYDMTYKDIKGNGGQVHFLSGNKTFELMRDGRVDALGKLAPIPAGDMMEASTTIDLKFISLGEQAINTLIDTFGVTRYTIPENSYDFQNEPYETINSPTILITHAEQDEETVYHMTQAIYNQLDYLYDVHKGFQKVNDETIIEVGGVPLHPGAEKFFKEKGLLQ